MSEEPIRVAQVMGYMNGGGVESVVMNYFRHIDRSRIQFDLIVCEGSSLVPREEIESLGGRVFTVPSYSHAVGFHRELKALFQAEKWSIVHSHLNTLSVFPLFAAKCAGIPVRIAHSHSTAGHDGLARNAMKYALRPFAGVFATNLLACSERAGVWLFGKHADFEVVPNAVDLKMFAPDPQVRTRVRASFGIPDNAFVLGHVGRFVPVKNHLFLLEIFLELKKLIGDARLLLVGDGPLRHDIEIAVAERGLSREVLILGQRDDVPDLMRAMDAFCLPSLYEGMPVVCIECQAACLPILMSNKVTREAAFTDYADFESLDAAPRRWAFDLMDMVKQRTYSGAGLQGLDLDECSRDLTIFYLKLMNGMDCK